MAIFNSYVDITRGSSHLITSHHNGMKLTDFTAARQVSVVDVSSPSPTTCSVSFQNLRWPSLQPLASPPSSEKVAHMTWRWEGHVMVDLTWPKTYRWTTLEMRKVSYVFVFAGFDLCSIPIHIPYIDLFGGSPYVLWIKRIKLSNLFLREATDYGCLEGFERPWTRPEIPWNTADDIWVTTTTSPKESVASSYIPCGNLK